MKTLLCTLSALTMATCMQAVISNVDSELTNVNQTSATIVSHPLVEAEQMRPLAFPGAEGWGSHAWGGRGGRVLYVTNLNDSGEGSLRWAVEQDGARTVVFAVDGTIVLQSPLRINNDSITIAGQSAPGDGICLCDYPLVVNASDVVVRYIRVRPGDDSGKECDGAGGGKYGQHDVILDHLSVSWSVDECLSFYKTRNLTVQWCLVSHSLRKSVHSKGKHGFGGIWGGNRASFHHNLLAHHTSRNPRFSSVDSTTWVDYRNNVVYNWGYKAAYGGGHHGTINFVGNYYKPGPGTELHKLVEVAGDGTSRYYVQGNVMSDDEAMTADNYLGVKDKGDSCTVQQPFPSVPIVEQQPEEAYSLVLQKVGCSLHRDSYDSAVVKSVEEGTGQFIDSPQEVGGWPLLHDRPAPLDTDRDGMPDDWERKHGLDPRNPADGAKEAPGTHYTQLEVYLNYLAAGKEER